MIKEYKEFKHNPKYLIYNDGRVYSKNVNRFMKPSISNGYLTLTLVHKILDSNNSINKKHMKRIHRLVASHFVDNNDPLKNIVDHIDCNKLNNHYTNLRWVTSKVNTEHALKNGVKSGNVKEVTIYDEKRNIIGVYKNITEASKQTGISDRTIYKSNKFRCIVSSNNIKYYSEYDNEKEKIVRPDGKLIPNYSDNYTVTKDGKVYSKHKKGYLNLETTRDGYKRICVKHKNLKSKILIHRLVAILYIQNDNEEKIQVNHKDGNKANNSVENLEWCTPSENGFHRIKLYSKLSKSVEQLDKESLSVINTFSSIADAARFHNMHHTSIANCVRGLRKTSAGFKWKYK